MNYRLRIVEMECLVAKYLVVIVVIYSGQQRYAGILPNLHFGWLDLMVYFFLSMKDD